MNYLYEFNGAHRIKPWLDLDQGRSKLLKSVGGPAEQRIIQAGPSHQKKHVNTVLGV